MATINIKPLADEVTPHVYIGGIERSSITVDYNSVVAWRVEAEGYVTQSGTETITEDKEIYVVLSKDTSQTYMMLFSSPQLDLTVLGSDVEYDTVEYQTEATFKTKEGYPDLVFKSKTVTSQIFTSEFYQNRGYVTTEVLLPLSEQILTGYYEVKLYRYDEQRTSTKLNDLQVKLFYGYVEQAGTEGSFGWIVRINDEQFVKLSRSDLSTAESVVYTTGQLYDTSLVLDSSELHDYLLNNHQGLMQMFEASCKKATITVNDGTSTINVDGNAKDGEQTANFTIRTDEICDQIYFTCTPWYQYDDSVGYEYGIKSVTINGQTATFDGSTANHWFTLEPNTTYNVDITFVCYYTGSAVLTTGSFYGCSYGLHFDPFADGVQGDRVNATISTSNGAYGPISKPSEAATYTFTIVPTPSDATVIIEGVEQRSAKFEENTLITWSVSRTGYATQTGIYIIGAEDFTMYVELVEEKYENVSLTCANLTTDYTAKSVVLTDQSSIPCYISYSGDVESLKATLAEDCDWCTLQEAMGSVGVTAFISAFDSQVGMIYQDSRSVVVNVVLTGKGGDTASGSLTIKQWYIDHEGVTDGN